jgi:ring-1,2-phenylacetyl-CoA epoxidase subunit PaaE
VVVSLRRARRAARQLRFQPGQYLTLRHDVDGQDLRRSYSICAGVDEASCAWACAASKGGVFSNWLQRVAPARRQSIEVMEPQGRFGAALAARRGAATCWHRRRQRHHAHPVDHEDGAGARAGSRFTLLYGNRNAASTMFKEELEDLKNRYLTRLVLHPVFSREQVDSPLNMGGSTATRSATSCAWCRPVDQAFVCGPHAMNDEAEAALRAAGLRRAHPHRALRRGRRELAADGRRVHEPQGRRRQTRPASPSSATA